MMARYLIERDNGAVSLAEIIDAKDAGDLDYKLGKTLFELSRDTDQINRYDREVHTFSALEAGIEGHSIIRVIGEIEDDRLPKSRYFRDAWIIKQDSVSIDMDKARAIHMDNIRRARDAKLSSLDIPWMIAMESGNEDTIASIVTQKVALRDIPQDYNLGEYSTPESLYAFWPDGLDRG